MTELLAVFGGTFDPVHCGHLRTAMELHDLIGADRTLLVPAASPPHRAPPVAPPAARLAMLQAACAGLPGIEVDDRELRRDGPSWTVDTLASLRVEHPDAALCLLLGSDAAQGLQSWHRWREILQLAHLVVAQRPGTASSLPPAVLAAAAHGLIDAAALRGSPAGGVVRCATSQLEISASHIRDLAAKGKSLRWLVPEIVEREIEENGWYRKAN